MWVNISSTFANLATYDVTSEVTTASQWKHLISGNSTGITPSETQNGLSSVMIGRLYRVGGGTGDTYAAAAALLSIDIHYEINTIGSREMLSK